MSERRLTAPITLAVTAVLVVVMAVWGVKALTAPIKDDPVATPAAKTEVSCGAGEKATVLKRLKRSQVQVSVYNTGKKVGRAQDTIDLLERAGFTAGAIGNGDAGDKVARAEVRTTKSDDRAAQLVALALGKNSKVVVVEETYGPGVDVFIGDKFHKLDPDAPTTIKLAEPKVTCS
ncbi:MAG: LytR family transcriptional regulator [Marmoricola sp.]|nr:LytR family transcriptional regulator [Marmoricola sp.]